MDVDASDADSIKAKLNSVQQSSSSSSVTSSTGALATIKSEDGSLVAGGVCSGLSTTNNHSATTQSIVSSSVFSTGTTTISALPSPMTPSANTLSATSAMLPSSRDKSDSSVDRTHTGGKSSEDISPVSSTAITKLSPSNIAATLSTTMGGNGASGSNSKSQSFTNSGGAVGGNVLSCITEISNSSDSKVIASESISSAIVGSGSADAAAVASNNSGLKCDTSSSLSGLQSSNLKLEIKDESDNEGQPAALPLHAISKHSVSITIPNGLLQEKNHCLQFSYLVLCIYNAFCFSLYDISICSHPLQICVLAECKVGLKHIFVTFRNRLQTE